MEKMENTVETSLSSHALAASNQSPKMIVEFFIKIL